MKKHLILLTAILSFGITHNCESAVKAKNNGEACEKAYECKSNVCTDKKCEPGKKNAGEKVYYLEECASQNASCVPNEEYWRKDLKKEKEGGPNVCEGIIKFREDIGWDDDEQRADGLKRAKVMWLGDWVDGVVFECS